jgi:glycosyltransferase involved in cell wall biosynthesis
VARSVYYFTDSRELGGAEEALLFLIEGLDRRSWQPTLLYHDLPAVAPLAQRARELGADARAIPEMPLGLVGARRVPGLVRELRRTSPSVFHAHLSWPLAAKYGLVAAVLARVPAVVATVHLFPQFRLDRSNYVQERLLAREVDRYIAVSKAIARQLEDTFHWPPEKIEVVHNAIRSDRFRVAADPGFRQQLAGGVNRPIVLTVARLHAQKGLDVLLQAASHVPDAQFVVAGDGPLRGRLRSQADELGLEDRLAFLGQREDIPRLLAASDVFVLPSLYEGTSLAVLEAMAAGRPVVSSRIGGTDELVVDGESGVLVPAGDADALAAAIRRLLADPALRARIGTAARQRAESLFCAAPTVARVTGVYEEVLARKAGHGCA